MVDRVIDPRGAGSAQLLLAAWYDLSGGEAEYLDWFHNKELPALAAHPDLTWIGHYRSETHKQHVVPELRQINERMAVRAEDAPDLGRGTQFLVLAAARDFSAMARIPDLIPSDGAGRDGAMRRLRVGHRRAAWAELMQLHGLSFDARVPGAPARLQHGSFNLHPGTADDLWHWYIGTRYPQTLASPGCIRVRQLFGLSGWPQFGIIYEFASRAEHMRFLESVEKREGLRGEADANHFQITKTTIHSPGGPTIGDRIWPPLPGAGNG